MRASPTSQNCSRILWTVANDMWGLRRRTAAQISSALGWFSEASRARMTASRWGVRAIPCLRHRATNSPSRVTEYLLCHRRSTSRTSRINHSWPSANSESDPNPNEGKELSADKSDDLQSISTLTCHLQRLLYQMRMSTLSLTLRCHRATWQRITLHRPFAVRSRFGSLQCAQFVNASHLISRTHCVIASKPEGSLGSAQI